jgi:hypothetical protein
MLKRFYSLAVLTAALALVACDDDDDVTGIDEIATVRIVNASPSTANLDVLLNDELLVGNVAFGSALATCEEVPAGTQTFVLRASGSSTDLVTLNTLLAENVDYTLVFNGTNNIDILTDDAAAPAAGTARIRFFNAANTGGLNIDVHATAPGSDAFGAQPTAADIAVDASSQFIDIPVGNNRIRFTEVGTTNVLLDIPTLTIPTNGILNVFLTQDAQGAYQFISSEPC